MVFSYWIQWLARTDARLGNLRLLVTAHAMAIAYESIDVLLNKPPSLDPDWRGSNWMISLPRDGTVVAEENRCFLRISVSDLVE